MCTEGFYIVVMTIIIYVYLQESGPRWVVVVLRETPRDRGRELSCGDSDSCGGPLPADTPVGDSTYHNTQLYGGPDKPVIPGQRS